jgi:tetratricopeptide (TPR) repeat protein
VDGLLVHSRYRYQIDDEHDLDWELFDEEVLLYKAAFDAHPGTILGRRILASLMPMLINSNELQTVYKTITSVAGDAPEDPVLRYDLGYVCFKLLDFEAALGHFEAAAERDPVFADAVLYRGFTLFALERMEEAAVFLDRARELDPEKNVLYKPLAISLYEAGRLGDAARACDRALEISPDDEDLKSLRILIRDRLSGQEGGNAEEAGGDTEEAGGDGEG